MIPSEKQIYALWEKYQLPEKKITHVKLVARVAVYIAKNFQVNTELLFAAALLHDIDKAVVRLPGERHPDTAVRVLREEGMGEVADVVVTHSLHSILDPAIAPKTWEQKILYLSDKMVKYDIVGVDERFALWRTEKLPQEEVSILNASYPKVKELEQEVFNLAQLSLHDILKLKEGIV